MANAYFYSNVAVQTTLSGSISAGALTITVGATTGFPSSFPYILAIDYGGSAEELVPVTAAAGTVLTLSSRGFGGTSAQSHSIGAVVRHVYNAIDATDFRTHEAATSGAHGITGSFVGTTDSQSLSNKTLVSPTITGTVAGGASYTGPTITSPTITGTVAGGASYTSPTITGTVGGSATYTSTTDRDATHVNSAIGVTPFVVNAIAGTTAALESVTLNASARRSLSAAGTQTLTPTASATDAYLANAATGFTGDLIDLQVNSTSQFQVNQAGSMTYKGQLTGGTAGQFTVSSTGAVIGTDFKATSMASSSFENTTTFLSNSTSYSDMTGSLTIIVPPSGKVLVNAWTRMLGNQNNGEMWAAVVVTGSTSGTIRAANDATAMYVRQGNNSNNSWHTSAQTMIITSANIGETLTIKMQGRAGTTASLTVSSDARGITAAPMLG